MAKILISYRREDSAYQAGSIRDQLASHFGRENVFIDIDSIPFGHDFRLHLDRSVGNCDYLIAVIGKAWLTVCDPAGERRLDDPADFVRLEIEAALKRDIPVIPVLVDNVPPPRADQLPESLGSLAYRNAIPIRPPPDFQHDVERLARDVDRQEHDKERLHRLREEAAQKEASEKHAIPTVSVPASPIHSERAIAAVAIVGPQPRTELASRLTAAGAEVSKEAQASPRATSEKPARPPAAARVKWLFAGFAAAVALSFLCFAPVAMALLDWWSIGSGDSPLVVSFVAMAASTIVATVLFELFLVECWRILMREPAGLPSTFEMISLQFVPLVHFYWWFVILGRLTAELNRALLRRQLPVVGAFVWLAPVTAGLLGVTFAPLLRCCGSLPSGLFPFPVPVSWFSVVGNLANRSSE